MSVQNLLTGQTYGTKAVPFILATDHGDVPCGKMISTCAVDNGERFTFQSQLTQITLTYRLYPGKDFLEKSVEVRNTGTAPLVVHKAITDRVEFSPGFEEIHPHYDPSQFRWLINIFLRERNGGFYFGIENPVSEHWTRGHAPAKSSVQLDYEPNLVLRPDPVSPIHPILRSWLLPQRTRVFSRSSGSSSRPCARPTRFRRHLTSIKKS
jgi:hypothetical protein